MIEQIRVWLADWVRRQYAEILDLDRPDIDRTEVQSINIDADKRRLALLKAEWQSLTGHQFTEPRDDHRD